MISADDSAKLNRRARAWLGEKRRIVGRSLTQVGVLNAISGCLVVPQAWLFAKAVSAVLVDGASLASTLPWLWPMLALFLARFLLAQLADRRAFGAAAKVKTAVRAQLLDKLQSLGPDYVRRKSSGALATSVVDGVDALEPYFVRFVPHMLVVAVVPLVIFAVVVSRDWISGLVLLITGPVIPLFMILIGYGTERLNQRQWRRLSQLSGRLLDSLQRLSTLQIFNATAREAEILERVTEDYRRSTMSVLRVAFLSSLMLEFFATVGIAVVAVLIGFRLLYDEMSFEVGFFALLLAPEFYAPLRQLGTNYHARMEAVGAAVPIVGILDVEEPATGAARPAFGPRIDIECEAIDFSYEPGQPALNAASLSLRAGTTTALVGPSGAGKSTLLDMVLGQRRPEAGRIVVDGHDLSEIAPDHWLQQVAVVPQRPHMFAGSVLDNITLGAPGVSLDAVREAARQAEADAFIQELPQGYDTQLGEHGQTLSGGQVQRIALARAFLKQAPVVVMDEGTTGLDRDTEALITRAVARLARDRTVLVVAHRLPTIRLADRSAVMEGGRIVEQGTHADLLDEGRRYARLLQNAGINA
jgi:ATP-binding cassette subfamily C protein CydD